MVKYHLGEKIFMTGSATQKPVKVQIVFAADDNYCQHMTAAMASILLNSRKGNEFVFMFCMVNYPMITSKKLKN